MATFLPLQDRVLLKRVATETTTASGLITIPDAHQEKPHEGIVIAVGPGKTLDSGQCIEPRVRKGDRVLFGKYTGVEIRIDGSEHVVCREDDILGVYSDIGID